MKTLLFLLMLVPLILINMPFAHSEQTEQVSQIAGETAQSTVEGDTIHVNNKLCAGTRLPIPEDVIGKVTGTVTYTGSNPKYNGKKLIFNFCCPGCEGKLQKRFSENPDEVLKFHGIE